jgi:hypothetical protein
MPFNISLTTLQRTKLWTFKKTPEALELQDLLDHGDRDGYVKRMLHLSTDHGDGVVHKFSRTKGVVYEMFDEGETIELPIKFQVKNSVITWSFMAPMDRTHQSFRDLVFNTAAKAHACVGNSCETYYRGTNHYHLKVMHTYAGESEFNHNHYRTADDGPITPVEVYEHLLAFYAQADGKRFIPSTEERDDIILKYAIYWADFNHDINYVAFSLLEDRGAKIEYQLREIAKAGNLSPDQADEQLDRFFASEHGKNMFKLAEKRGFPGDARDLAGLKEAIKGDYRRIYMEFSPKVVVELDDPSLEPQRLAVSPRSTPSSRRSSPRDEYLSSPDQALDPIDEAEYEVFAADLTKHCQRLDKSLLDDLKLEDFRKALLLYYALRTAQEKYEHSPPEGLRFHKDLTTDANILKMIEELPSLQHGSTEDDLGAPLINKLLMWITTASPKLEEWVNWVSKNGSRGLGSEIAQVRQADGAVDLRQAVPQGDRDPKDKLAEIDFGKADLRTIFFPAAGATARGGVLRRVDEQIEILSRQLATELQQLVSDQVHGSFKLEKSVYRAKVAVIQEALDVLSGNSSLDKLLKTLEANVGWDSVPMPGMRSTLNTYVEQIFVLVGPSAAPGPSV